MTDYLYVEPSFFRGIASLGNLGGQIAINASETPEESDYKALQSDWLQTGNDIKQAIQKYEEISEKQQNSIK